MNSRCAGRRPVTTNHPCTAPRAATPMPKTVEIPGQQALISPDDLPEGAVVATTTPADDMTFADWCDEAEPWYIDRASKPGWFTAYNAIKDAPNRIRNPRNPNWPGMFMHRFHDLGYVDYARTDEGLEVFTTSEKPESGGSAVRVWVGVEEQRKAAAA